MKKDKDADQFRNALEWRTFVPDEVKQNFDWPTDDERKQWLDIRGSRIIVVSTPSRQVGTRWNFYRVFEAIEEGDYDLLSCQMTVPGVGEMHINPNGYPYGGVGPLIALAEGYGFNVLGVNECGRFENRDELLGNEPEID